MENVGIIGILAYPKKQGRKCPLDAPKRMIERREREGERERSRRKSSGNLTSGEIKRKVWLIKKIMMRNYQQKLSGEIMTQNYQLVYYRSENVGIIGILRIQKNKIFVHP